MEARNAERTPLIVTSQPRSCSPLKVTLVVVLVLIVTAALVTTLTLVFRQQDPAPYTPVHSYSKAAVVSDAKTCSTIGKDILLKGGSSVDSAIATSLCIGVFSMQSSGIGGGSFMMIYERPRHGEQKELRALDFREVAPLAANLSVYNTTGDMYSSGGFSVGVPSEIAGYWEAWQRYGRLPWSDLFKPTIKICKEGFKVPEFLAEQILDAQDYSIPSTCKTTSNIRDLLYKSDGSLYLEGDTMKLPKLASTLEKISSSNGTDFYTGTLSVDLLQDLHETGSLITATDLYSVKPVWREPLNFTVGDVELSTLPLPSGGPVLNLILNILKAYSLSEDKTLNYHRVVEADKFAYALKTKMGDPKFRNLTQVFNDAISKEYAAGIRARLDDDHTHDIPYYKPLTEVVENHGTSHINVLTEDGAAVALTSTINSEFGSKCVGSRTGIIFNNEISDFLTPSDASSYRSPNLIDGGKKPQSAMCPTILFDKDNHVTGVIGGSGGSKITTTVAFVLWNYLLAGRDIEESVTAPRLHHKLTPNVLNYEPDFPQDILQGLQAKGHNTKETSSIAVSNSIQSTCHKENHEKNCITAVADKRKLGEPDGF